MKDRITPAQRLQPIKQGRKGFRKNVVYLFLAFYAWAMIFGALLYTI